MEYFGRGRGRGRGGMHPAVGRGRPGGARGPPLRSGVPPIRRGIRGGRRFGSRRHFGGRYGFRRFGGIGYGLPYGVGYHPLYATPYSYYDEPEPSPQEPNWVGKRLIRRGDSPTPVEIQDQNFVLESNVPSPYAIIPPGGATPSGSVSNRLLIYIDDNNVINSVVYA